MASYYVRSGAAGAGTGADWANAFTTLGTAVTGKAAGDIFYVAADHAETAASAKTIAPPGTAAAPNLILCVDHTGSVPPVAADLRTTATITTTGTNAITLTSGHAYWYGITISCGTGGGAPAFSILTSDGVFVFENCVLKLPVTGASPQLILGSATAPRACIVELRNTSLSFGSLTAGITLRGVRLVWKNTASALDSGATIPTTLFNGTNPTGNSVYLEGVDLSAAGSGKTLIGAIPASKQIVLKDCQIDSAVTVAATPTESGYAETLVLRSDSSATNYRNEKYQYMGTQTTSTSVIRTGGASDGVTGVAMSIATTADPEWHMPFEAIPVAIWNDTTGSNVTMTIEGVYNAAALPNNDEIWFDLEYQGSASAPLGTIKSGSKATILTTASAHSASTQSWDSQVTARADSTAYSLGAIRKVASNPGRIFFCTTAGTSAGSEPAGYASAVDGGSVTDGTAVFRAGMRFKMAVTATSPQPQAKGYIYAYVRAAKVSTTFYVCPKVALS